MNISTRSNISAFSYFITITRNHTLLSPSDTSFFCSLLFFHFSKNSYQIEIQIMNQKIYFQNCKLNLIMNRKIYYQSNKTFLSKNKWQIISWYIIHTYMNLKIIQDSIHKSNYQKKKTATSLSLGSGSLEWIKIQCSESWFNMVIMSKIDTQNNNSYKLGIVLYIESKYKTCNQVIELK
jgi:hypothetical protein